MATITTTSTLEVKRIIQGDSLAVLKTLPDNSIDCCVTSPPYWALRDYGTEGQLGLEPTLQEYITKLMAIFDEVKRVLKPAGTCWVNLGDTYASKSKGSGGSGKMGDGVFARLKERAGFETRKFDMDTIQDKSLCMVPERFAIAMIDKGWILRNKIIWHKPNAMPSSIRDRFGVDYEVIYFFTKNQQYYFETQYEPLNQDSLRMSKRGKTNPKGMDRQGLDTWKVNPLGRIKRSVWSISTKPFHDAHFAVFPEELIETPIKAGCPVNGVTLDPFMGSGTTAVTSLKLGRNYLGIELNPEYIEIANRRIKETPIQTKLLL